MSQFAHGIHAIDTTIENERVELLGKCYPNLNAAQEAYQHQFESIIWLTYRKDFPQMNPYEYTNDAGWGCMLRTTQMLLAHALQRLVLGKSNWGIDWNVPLPIDLIEMLKWFVDSTSSECLYSIHHMVKVGIQYDKLPGEWFGPTTAAQVARDLVNGQRGKTSRLSMYVPQDGVIYSDQVMELCTEVDEKTCSGDVGMEYSPTTGVMYDPLLNPRIEKRSKVDDKWTTAILILVPLRLGLDSVHESYIPALQQVFTIPHCVGIVGGKRGHSVYFVGVQGTKMHILDPHTVHPAAQVDSSFPSATHLRTMHCSTPLGMEMRHIDPSLAIGFLCQDRDDYLSFCTRVEALSKTCILPFAISASQPNYESLDDMDDLEDEVSEMGSISDRDDDDEYVLI